jgi:Domain of unknown function (DUF4192)
MTRRTAPSTLPAEPTVLRIREPGDILGVIPYLLGFHPTESLVASFVSDRRVAVTARIDLAATADIEALVDQLEMVGERVGTRSVVLVGYSADDGIRELMRDLAGLIPLDLVDVLAVSGQRWWSVCCDGECCPAEGQPYDVASHPLAAEAVVAGISATATREEIVALTAGPVPEDRDRLHRLTEACVGRLAGTSVRRRRRRIKQVVGRALDAGGPTEGQAIEIAVLAEDLTARDEAWALMSRQRADDHVALWRRVVSVAVWPFEAAPLGMLAMAGWVSGNGALLNCCIDRLEEVAPDYSLLDLCRDISDRAIPPSTFDALAREMRAALD